MAAHQALPSLGFSRQEHWSRLPFPSPMHTSRVMLKILQARLQQFVNVNFQVFKLDLEKAEEPEIKLPTSSGSSKKQENFLYFCFIDNAKAFDCVDHNKLWKILNEMGIPDHLTCLLRNLYAGQEATVRTGHRTTNWFQIGKGVHQGCILSLCLFSLYAEYIYTECQAGWSTSWNQDCQEKYRQPQISRWADKQFL